jgi:dolichyl-phosphate-mannose-protein mannosyltransferase
MPSASHPGVSHAFGGSAEISLSASRVASHTPRATADSRSRRLEAALGCLLILPIAGYNCFHRLGEPAHPIWDESYYLTSTARYETGRAQFASHPPLGLMLIAAGDHLSGLNRDIYWQPIAALKKVDGEAVPAGFSFLGVRCASALFGTLAASLFFALLLTIELRPTYALLLTTPFLFDTALIAQFRAAQLDSFQLFFMLATLIALMKAMRTKKIGWLFAFGLFCGCATMVRANAALLSVGALWPVLLGAQSVLAAPIRSLAFATVRGLAAITGFFLASVVVFTAHVALSNGHMPPASPEANADTPYVEPAYAAYIDGRAGLDPAVVVAAADGYRRFMAADLAGIGIGDPKGSSPWGWPFGRGSIVYRWDSDGITTTYIALIPNSAAWLLSLAGVVGTFVTAMRDLRQRHKRKVCEGLATGVPLLLIWTVLMGANIVLASHRVMYLYHYFMPLVLGWVMIGLLFRGLTARASSALVERLAGGVAGLVLANFLLLSPLALHRSLGPSGCAIRSWGSGLRCKSTPTKVVGASSPSAH